MSIDAVGLGGVAGAQRHQSKKPPADGSDERLSLRRAAMLWIASAAAGWLLTVGLVWAVTQAI